MEFCRDPSLQIGHAMSPAAELRPVFGKTGDLRADSRAGTRGKRQAQHGQQRGEARGKCASARKKFAIGSSITENKRQNQGDEKDFPKDRDIKKGRSG